MAQEMITFDDIVDAIREKLGVQSSDSVATAKIKRAVNIVYLNEVVPYKDYWMWLRKTINVIHEAAYETGTVTVTNASASAALSATPTGKNFTGYKFSVQGSNQIYTVGEHTTSSTTLPLTVAFQETTASGQEFKIWRDRVDLPTNVKETVEIWHKDLPHPLEGVGYQELRQIEAAQPKYEGTPLYYNTADYYDPSTSGDDETESDRYRQTRIFPAITDANVILNIDCIQEATALEDDADEPLMPVNDRVVLFYGGLAEAYSTINRNEEMHAIYWQKFQAKLARMAGKREEGMDTPKLRPNPSYFNRIRFSGLRRRGRC